ncbi:hypothetical protein C8R45DRAFT_488856 [Mycena sanguinolenta]|nr:hypothetical protein C8R45DRAFT_488856 [Mycena sanguinolenta]
MATASSFSVRAMLEQAREYLKTELEQRIEESEVKLKSLETQLELCDRERAVVAVMRYLLSPIYGIPAELLAEIFERAIDEETHIMDVFRVSQVCSDWRQVAQNTPRLWTGRISVTLDNRGYKREQSYTDGFTEWLARSAALTIPITLRLVATNIYHDLLGEVLKTTSRWRSLELDFPDHGLLLMNLVRRVAQRRLDSLEELDLGRTQFLEPLGGGVFPSFTNAPRLRKLSMSISSSLPILAPWAKIIDLTLHYCSSPDLALDALALCANLVRLSVRTAGWSGLPQARQHNLALTRLRTLSFALFSTSLSGSAVVLFTAFFNDLSAPALQELSLTFLGMRERWTETHFTTFQLQAPNITQLDLRDAENLTSAQFRTVLLHAPSLTHLKLFRCPCFDESAMTALRYEDGITPVVPCLHHLVLECIAHHVSDSDILASMIATRWWTDAALASRSVPPAVARWTHLELWSDLSEHPLLKDIPSHMLTTSSVK